LAHGAAAGAAATRAQHNNTQRGQSKANHIFHGEPILRNKGRRKTQQTRKTIKKTPLRAQNIDLKYYLARMLIDSINTIPTIPQFF
jgi:hypothetical protein